jgi:hypothetical protein
MLRDGRDKEDVLFSPVACMLRDGRDEEDVLFSPVDPTIPVAAE